jgi:hypothetical protein
MNMMPSMAKAIPTEQIKRYFHVASKDKRLQLKYINGALDIVVASTANHRRPKWRAVIARVMALKKINKQGTITLLPRSRRISK